jgi:hypothetical protein
MVTKTIGSTFWSNDWINGEASRMGCRNLNLADSAAREVKSRKDEVGKIQKTIRILFDIDRDRPNGRT